MTRILFCLLIFTTCLLPVYPENKQAIIGTIELKETIDGKTSVEVVNYTIIDKFARIDPNPKLYYIVELDTEKAYLINNKRKTVTLMYASEIMNHTLPPLMILKDKTSMKKYLTSTNAHLEDVVHNGANKYEYWRFNIGSVYYKIQILLPDYYPKIIYITSQGNKTMATILEKEDVSAATIPENLFIIPKDYKKVNLISQ